jgi:spoIIIJ-associated protein
MSGKTLEEAIEIALLELGAGRDEVEVSVVSKGRTGILGIGSEPARVRVVRISKEGGSASPAIEIISRLLRILEVDALPTIRSSGSGSDDPPAIDIQGDDAGLLIGRRGETLQALQFVVNMLLSRQQGERSVVTLDVEQYRERRHQSLGLLANRTADRVASSDRPITLEPMSAADRRIIHMSLSDHRRVATESTGEGQGRRVTIRPLETEQP